MAEPKQKGRKPRRWLRVLGALIALAGLAALGLVAEMWKDLGTAPDPAWLAAHAESSTYEDGRFVNTLPMEDPEVWPATVAWLTEGSDHASPEEPVPIEEKTAAEYAAAPASGLRITWLGHSTLLVEIDGKRVLTDPVWGERSSPSDLVGPTRFHPPPLPLSELPPIDAVVISHDHFDHLDTETIVALAEGTDVPFYVPLGVGAHLRYWDVPSARVHELDWWDRQTLGDVTLVATPARHFSGRGLSKDATLWAGWAILGPEHRVFFSGDTGMFPGFAEIGERLGPFDATMLEVGAYNMLWRDVHLGPEQAIEAHRLLRGEVMFPVHWGTFDLALHSWIEPPERLIAEARRRDVRLVVPRPGERIEPSDAPEAVTRWWPELPWETAEEAPVVSSNLEAPTQTARLDVRPRPRRARRIDSAITPP